MHAISRMTNRSLTVTAAQILVVVLVLLLAPLTQSRDYRDKKSSSFHKLSSAPLHSAARSFIQARGLDIDAIHEYLSNKDYKISNDIDFETKNCGSVADGPNTCSSRESVLGKVQPLVKLFLPSPSFNASFGNKNYTLSKPCNQKYCSFLLTALSCKALPIHMPKICARYFLGSLLHCPQFPPLDDLLNAPLLCAEPFAYLIAALAKTDVLAKIEADFLKTNMTVNCHRRCYQRYIGQGYDLFYGDNSDGCRSEYLKEISLKSATSIGDKEPTTSHYPFMEIFYLYRMFRQQSCVASSSNSNNKDNCYEKIRYNAPLLLELVRSKNEEAFACQAPAITPVVQQDLTNLFVSLGCCYGSSLAYMLQSPTNLTELPVFPPCQLHYVAGKSHSASFPNGISPGNVCSDCSNSNMTVINFQLNITGAPGTSIDTISIFERRAVLKLQEALTTYILTADLARPSPSADPTFSPTLAPTLSDDSGEIASKNYRDYPYYIDAATPFYFQIINYQYYKKLSATSNKYTPLFTSPTTPANYSAILTSVGGTGYLQLDVILVLQGLPKSEFTDHLVDTINNVETQGNLGKLLDGLFIEKIPNIFKIMGMNTTNIKNNAFEAVTPTSNSASPRLKQLLPLNSLAALIALLTLLIV